MKSIEKLNSKEASDALAALAARRREITVRLAAIRPPRPVRGAPGPTDHRAPAPDPLAGCGPEFRRVALEGTPAEMAALVQERTELDAELSQVDFRTHMLKARHREAVEEERRRAAPGRLKKLLEGADDVLDELDRARAALRAAEQAKGAHFRDLAATRDLVGADAPGLSPAQVRKALEDDEGELSWLTLDQNGDRAENASLLRAVVKFLEPLPVPLIERLRRRFPVNEDPFGGMLHSESSVSADVARVRARLLASNELDAVNDYHLRRAGGGQGAVQRSSHPSPGRADQQMVAAGPDEDRDVTDATRVRCTSTGTGNPDLVGARRTRHGRSARTSPSDQVGEP